MSQTDGGSDCVELFYASMFHTAEKFVDFEKLLLD